MLQSSQGNRVAWHLVTSYSVMKLVGPTGESLYYTGQVQVGAIFYFYITFTVQSFSKKRRLSL